MQYVGKLLVAPPSQKDPFWRHTVVWIYEWDQGRYAGLIINKSSPKGVRDLAEHHRTPWRGSEPLMIGGPVNPGALILMHTDDWQCSNTMRANNSIAISSSNEMLRRLSRGDRPEQWRLLLGHATWAPGQLEQEIDKPTGWLVTDWNPEWCWHTEDDLVWTEAVSQSAADAVDKLFAIR